MMLIIVNSEAQVTSEVPSLRFNCSYSVKNPHTEKLSKCHFLICYSPI